MKCASSSLDSQDVKVKNGVRHCVDEIRVSVAIHSSRPTCCDHRLVISAQCKRGAICSVCFYRIDKNAWVKCRRTGIWISDMPPAYLSRGKEHAVAWSPRQWWDTKARKALKPNVCPISPFLSAFTCGRRSYLAHLFNGETTIDSFDWAASSPPVASKIRGA